MIGAIPLEAPAVELREDDGAEHDGVHDEGQVVEAHRRLGRARVARGILLADQRRVEEGEGRDQVADESEHVDGGKVNGETDGRPATPVEDRLGVERQAPAEETVVPGSVSNPVDHSRCLLSGPRDDEPTHYIHPSTLYATQPLVSAYVHIEDHHRAGLATLPELTERWPLRTGPKRHRRRR